MNRVLGSLIRGVRDADPLVRLHAIDTLCCIADKKGVFNPEANAAVPVAREALKDPDPDVRECAGFLLSKRETGTLTRIETSRWKLYMRSLKARQQILMNPSTCDNRG